MISPRQYLVLWRLAVSTGGAEWNTKIKPAMEKADRVRLVKAGLIEVETRNREPPKATQRCLFVSRKRVGPGWRNM